MSINKLCSWLLMSAFLATAAISRGGESLSSSDLKTIRISTSRFAVKLFVGEDGRLYEGGFGRADANLFKRKANPDREIEFHPPSGDGFICEPAIQATHGDGNNSTDLIYVD